MWLSYTTHIDIFIKYQSFYIFFSGWTDKDSPIGHYVADRSVYDSGLLKRFPRKREKAFLPRTLMHLKITYMVVFNDLKAS